LKGGADEIGGVEAEVKWAQCFAEGEVAVLEFPIGEECEVTGGVGGEDGLAEVEEIDSAVESARAGLGAAVSAFGDGADDSVISRYEGEDLRGFAIFGLSQADGGGRDQRHTRIIVGWNAEYRMPNADPAGLQFGFGC
jgi:hypothetical protein